MPNNQHDFLISTSTLFIQHVYIFSTFLAASSSALLE